MEVKSVQSIMRIFQTRTAPSAAKMYLSTKYKVELQIQ